MKLLRQVKVYALLTENLRQALLSELQQQQQQIQRKLDELAWQQRKLEAEASTAAEIFRQIDQERKRGLEAMHKASERYQEVLSLPLGIAMLHSTAEAVVEVAVGDLWEEKVNPEIILEDGRVVAIRERGSDSLREGTEIP